jgi:hypothetical protein
VNRNQRNQKVTEELKYIPQGSVYQNMLRAGYHNMRRRELGRNPALTAKDTLFRAIETVRKENRNFLPEYDKKFFDIQAPTLS